MRIFADRYGYLVGAGLVALGAILRLWRIDYAPFLLDQGGYYTIAQNAVANGALPVAGISSSIGTLTQPAAVLFYLPFALLRDPVFGMYATAAVNIGGLALNFGLAWRHFGLVTATVSTLLLAVSENAVRFSQGIWQQNLLSPVALMLFTLVLSGAQSGRGGWLAWAVPVWGLAVQLHPTAAPLLALVVAAWALAPHTVRARDVLIGLLALAVLFGPSIVWGIACHYCDVWALVNYTRRPAVVDAQVISNLVGILNVSPWVEFHSAAGEVVARGASIALPIVGVVYLCGHVTGQALGALRPSWKAFSGWARASEQAQWRGKLLLMLWLLGILAPQVRHHSPLYIFYLIGALPAMYLAAGIFVERVARGEMAWRGGPALARLVWLVGMSVTMLAVIIGVLAQYDGNRQRGEGSFSLRAWKRELAAAASLVRTAGVSDAVIQTDYFTLDSMLYLLRNGWRLGVATHVASTERAGSSPRCLTVPARGSVLYLVAERERTEGAYSPVETYVRGEVGAPAGPGGAAIEGSLRGYVMPLEAIERIGAKSGGTAGELASVEFGGVLALRSLWRERAPHGTHQIVLGFTLEVSSVERDYGESYRITAAAMGEEGQELSRHAIECFGAPWIMGQRLLVFLPSGERDAGARVARLRVSVEARRAAPYPSRLGSLRLESILGAPSGHYFLGREGMALLPRRCQGAGVECISDGAMLRLDRD